MSLGLFLIFDVASGHLEPIVMNKLHDETR